MLNVELYNIRIGPNAENQAEWPKVRHSARKDPYDEMDEFNEALRATRIPFELNQSKAWRPKTPAWTWAVAFGITAIILAASVFVTLEFN